MKKTYFLAIALITIILTSCGSDQKPTPRIDVWGDETKKTSSMSNEKILVPFQRTESDLAEIQVSLNGVPFNMWWDTGATITCISALELQKLAKEGKFKLSDAQGTAVSRLADGSSEESLIINIKEIRIQGKDNNYLEVFDINAAVSANAKAPLLLGQDVIQNLPKHSFNEEEGVIEFEHE